MKALLVFAQDVAFAATGAEGVRIAERVFNELPLDANVSDGNESADPADHIVPCVRAALAERDDNLAALTAERDRLREALEEVIALRAYQLEQTCPDCEDGCTHGVRHDKLTLAARAALKESR